MLLIFGRPQAIVLVLHPILVTPAMAVVTVAIILKLKFSKNASGSSPTSLAAYSDFQKSIVFVCIFFVLSQVTNFVYFVLRGLKSERQYDAFYFCSLLTMINSTGNFFIYSATSKKFRRALKRHFWSPLTGYS